MGRVERHVEHPRLEHPENACDERHSLLDEEDDRHGVDAAPSDQGIGDLIAPPVELFVGERRVVVLHRQPGTVHLDLLREPADQ
jgi:hypothetical protein